jgi:hypothetical protein
MTKSPSLRDQIESAAQRLGATRASVFKWRSRGIPSEWRLKLLADAETNFTIDDFERVRVEARKKICPFRGDGASGYGNDTQGDDGAPGTYEVAALESDCANAKSLASEIVGAAE